MFPDVTSGIIMVCYEPMQHGFLQVFSCVRKTIMVIPAQKHLTRASGFFLLVWRKFFYCGESDIQKFSGGEFLFFTKKFSSRSGEKNSSGPSRGLWRHAPPGNFENLMPEIV